MFPALFRRNVAADTVGQGPDVGSVDDVDPHLRPDPVHRVQDGDWPEGR